jgi:hypothetical protein
MKSLFLVILIPLFCFSQETIDTRNTSSTIDLRSRSIQFSALAMKLSSDGKYLLTSGLAPEVILWDVKTLSPIRKFKIATTLELNKFHAVELFFGENSRYVGIDYDSYGRHSQIFNSITGESISNDRNFSFNQNGEIEIENSLKPKDFPSSKLYSINFSSVNGKIVVNDNMAKITFELPPVNYHHLFGDFLIGSLNPEADSTMVVNLKTKKIKSFPHRLNYMFDSFFWFPVGDSIHIKDLKNETTIRLNGIKINFSKNKKIISALSYESGISNIYFYNLTGKLLSKHILPLPFDVNSFDFDDETNRLLVGYWIPSETLGYRDAIVSYQVKLDKLVETNRILNYERTPDFKGFLNQLNLSFLKESYDGDDINVENGYYKVCINTLKKTYKEQQCFELPGPSGDGFNFGISKKKNKFYTQENRISLYTIINSEVSSLKEINSGERAKFSFTGKYFFYENDSKLYSIDFSNENKETNLWPYYMQPIATDSSDTKLLCWDGSNLFNLIDIVDKKMIASFFLLDSVNWVTMHPSGLFDTPTNITTNLYFVQGLDIIDFNQLKERYYEPGLWKKIVTGEKLRNVVGFKSIDLPPDIRVGEVDKKGYLPIELINRGGGIGEVTIYIHGKEVIKDARDKKASSDAPSIKINYYVGNHKNLINGENFIAVKAWNKDHWVESRGAVISYNSKQAENYKPVVHILSCGVSDYTGTEIDLKYAAKDAEDVSKAIQLGAKQLFGADNSYAYTLTTDRPKEFYPTKVNILKTLNKISTMAHPLDVFVMYVSGHGINYGGQDGDWHYLTQDAYTGNGSAYNDPAIRQQTTISSNELVELFKKVPALKQVLMIDACASGRVVENLISQKDISSSTIRALDRMRDRTGMHIITGCTADAVSYEASKYGQGVLTYSLLEGIRGAALREDKFIDINKLFQYAHDRVPTLAEGIGGIQTPQIFSPQGAQSFDIGLLTENEKKEIPIAKIRPVYIRSNFQDENELEDILGLGKSIDEALNETSSKGADAKLIFVDVKEYPDGCKLIGRYQKVDGKLILKLRKKCGEETTNFEIKADTVDKLKEEILKVL